jgi:hypothetical protein
VEKISHVLAHEKPAGETLVNFMQSITCGQLAGHAYGKSSGRPMATSSLPAMAAGTLDRCGKVIGSATTNMDPIITAPRMRSMDPIRDFGVVLTASGVAGRVALIILLHGRGSTS